MSILARIYLVVMVIGLCSCRPHEMEMAARNRVRRQSGGSYPVNTPSTSTTVPTTTTRSTRSSTTTTNTSETVPGMSSTTASINTTSTQSTPTPSSTSTTETLPSSSGTTKTSTSLSSSSTVTPINATSTPTTMSSSKTTTASTTTTPTQSTTVVTSSTAKQSTSTPSTISTSQSSTTTTVKRPVNNVNDSDSRMPPNPKNFEFKEFAEEDPNVVDHSTTTSGTTTVQSTTQTTESTTTPLKTTTISATTISTESTTTESTTAAATTTKQTSPSTATTSATTTATTTTEEASTSTASLGVVYKLSLRDLAIGEDDDDMEDTTQEDEMEEVGPCPAGFIQVDDRWCFYALSKRLSWTDASDACRYQDPSASLVAINCEQEQLAVKAVSSLLDYDMCPKFWTAGQRAKLNHPAMQVVPLVWKLRDYVWQTMFEFTNWPMVGPDASGDCVHVVSTGTRSESGWTAPGTWGTGSCEELHCAVCEIAINATTAV